MDNNNNNFFRKGDYGNRSERSERDDRSERYDRNDRYERNDRNDRNSRGGGFVREERSESFNNNGYYNQERRDNRDGFRGRDNNRSERRDYNKDNRKPKEVTQDDDLANEINGKQLLVFGARPVMEAIEGEKQIDKVYLKKGSDSPLVARVMQLCRENRIATQEVPIEKLNRLTKGNHQGIVAQIAPIEYYEISDVIADVEKSGVAPLIVVMDSVTDVRNFGAIARSAECAGAHAIIMSMKNSAPVNAEAIRSSAGALTIIPVCRVGSIKLAIASLKEMGMQVVAANEKADQLVYDADLTKPTVIVMGSEDKGISKDIMKMCDCQISIPLIGSVESLNVSCAASVILFETVRQRLNSLK